MLSKSQLNGRSITGVSGPSAQPLGPMTDSSAGHGYQGVCGSATQVAEHAVARQAGGHHPVTSAAGHASGSTTTSIDERVHQTFSCAWDADGSLGESGDISGGSQRLLPGAVVAQLQRQGGATGIADDGPDISSPLAHHDADWPRIPSEDDDGHAEPSTMSVSTLALATVEADQRSRTLPPLC